MLASLDLPFALARATLFTSAAVAVAWLLNTSLRASSPRFQRAAWTLAIAQGWLLFPWTLQIATDVVEPTPAAFTVRTAVEASVESNFNRQSLADARDHSADDAAHLWLLCSRWLLTAWSAGATFLVLSRVIRYAKFVRRLPNGHGDSADETHWQAEWHDQLTAARLPRPVELRFTSDLGPLVCFVPFYYLVLTPRKLWQSLTHPERRAILQHELAHLTRGDVWKSLAIRLMALPQWFNPLVWQAVRRFDEAGEWACDDRVTHAAGGSQLQLAKSLVRAAEFVASGVPATASAQGGILSRRIRRLVTPQVQEGSKMKKVMFVTLLAALAAVQAIRIERVAAASQAAATDSAVEIPAQPPSMVGSIENLKGTNRPWNGQGPYIIEPPDVLTITYNQAKFEPGADYKLQPRDVMEVQTSIPPEKWTTNNFTVEEDGTIDFKSPEVKVKVSGLTIGDARDAIRQAMRRREQTIEVNARLTLPAGKRQVSDHYLVGPDGRVNFGKYGSVYVAGMTIDEARAKLSVPLSKYFENPQLVVDVYASNSKKIYIVTQGEGGRDDVSAMPCTGNETVLDAIAMIGGISEVGSKAISIVRPAPNGEEEERLVNWADISTGKSMETNYPLQARDRLYISKQIAPTPAPSTDKAAGRTADFAVPVVLEKANGRTFPVVTALCDGQINVATAIAGAKVWPNPVDLTKARIEVRRPGADGNQQILPVAWEPKSHQPTAETNHRLQPGDKIVIRDEFGPQPQPSPGNAVAATQAMPPGYAPEDRILPDPYEGKTFIYYRAMIVKDTSDSMGEFISSPSSREIPPGAIVDTATMDATLRILMNNKLVEMISRPQMMTLDGETTMISIDSEKGMSRKGFQMEVTGKEIEKGVSLAVKREIFEGDRLAQAQTSVGVEPHKSVILKFPSLRPAPNVAAAASSDKSDEVYIVLTPEVRRPKATPSSN